VHPFNDELLLCAEEDELIVADELLLSAEDEETVISEVEEPRYLCHTSASLGNCRVGLSAQDEMRVRVDIKVANLILISLFFILSSVWLFKIILNFV
jgi:hypothetical protein